MVHEDAAHDLGAQRQEMHPIFAANPPGAHQLEIRLVGECRRFNALAGTLVLKVTVRDTPQLRIHKFDQAVKRVGVAAIPGGEESGNVLLALVCHTGQVLHKKCAPANHFWARSRNTK
jgi:hypothetical protein